MKISIYLPGVTGGTAWLDGHEEIDLSEIGEVDNASCSEVFVGECLDFIEQRKDFGNELVKKIAYDGTIIISGADIFEVCRAITTCQIDLAAANEILYKHRCSISNVFDVANWIRQAGLKVISQRVESFKYTIIAKRPLPKDGKNTNAL